MVGINELVTRTRSPMLTDGQAAADVRLRAAVLDLALVLDGLCPPSPEADKAHDALDLVLHHACAAVARRG